MNYLSGRKTHIVAVLMILAGVVKVAAGDMTLTDLWNSNDINLILEGLGLGALRLGIAKRL